MATQSYCDHLGRLDLTWWKLRLLTRFYSRKSLHAAAGGFLASLRRGLSGLRGDAAHASKLQTAFRVAARSAVETLRTKMRPGWMSRADERRLFEGWDGIFRELRRRNFELGVETASPADTRELHRTNVMTRLAKTHGSRHELPVVPDHRSVRA